MSVNTAINSVVRLLKDVVKKLNVQGGLIQTILDDIKKKPSDETYKEEFEKLKKDLDDKMKERKS